jgi:hypothetical protein
MGCARSTVRPGHAPDRLPLSGDVNVAATIIPVTQDG